MHVLRPEPYAVCSVLSKVSSPAPATRETIAPAPSYGVAGSPVVPTTRMGAAPVTRTSPSLSPRAGLGMPAQPDTAQAPPHGGSSDWNRATSASSRAALRGLGSGRSTQLITAFASTTGAQVPSTLRPR